MASTRVLTVNAGWPTFTSVQTVMPTVYSIISTGLTVTAGTAITLPSSRTYNSTELAIYVNGQRQQLTTNFAYVGSAPRTQVTFTRNITSTDEILFEILRDQ